MPSYSTNLNLAKPTVGGDTNQWGGYLNTNTDTLDAIFNGAGTGTSVGLQVGSGKTLKVGGTLTATGSSSFSGTVSLSSTVQLTGSQNELRFFEAIGGADNYVALKAPNEMTGNNNYSLVLPAAQGTAGQFLKLTSLSGSEGLLQFADAGGQADNYFATSGLSSKDLGVGLHIKTGDSGATVSGDADELVIENGSASNMGMTLLSATNGQGHIMFGDSDDNNVGFIAYNHSDNSMKFITNASERMRIKSDGRICFGVDTQQQDGRFTMQGPFSTNRGLVLKTTENGGTAIFFDKQGSGAGYIQINTNNTVSYNTSSDYRLKENVSYDFDAITRLKQLKPARFNWIVDETDTTVDGFIAHEVSSVVPEAIDGIKDATETYTDDNGDEQTRIVPQAIDQAKLVPLITKALQEAITKIESLESEIDQLKGVN